METYNYLCPGCGGKDLSFLEIVGDTLLFFCNLCKKKFFTPDQEDEFLPHKVVLLRGRYPEKKEAAASFKTKNG